MTLKNKIDNTFIDLFKQAQQMVFPGEDQLFRRIRKKAYRNFTQHGIPSLQNEEYKYTDLISVFDKVLKIALTEPTKKKTNNCYKGSAYHNIYLHNGWFISHDINKEGVVVCSLKNAAKKHTKICTEYYNKTNIENNGLIALNTMLAADGLFLYIPTSLIIDKPIQIINFLSGADNTLVNSRILLIIEKHAQAKIIVRNHSDTVIVNNLLSEIYINDNAQAAIYTLQDHNDWMYDLHSTIVHQKKQSHLMNCVATLSGKVVRNNLYVNLDGENCNSELYGFYFPSGKQHVDNFTAINHTKPGCISEEHYKGVIGKQGSAAFCGRIHIFRYAQQTQAYQTNNNFLLSNDAVINTKPQLIIDADDVKCSHGATVGQMDKDAMFYLRTRGIPEKMARKILIRAFIEEITEKISTDMLKKEMNKRIIQKLNRIE